VAKLLPFMAIAVLASFHYALAPVSGAAALDRESPMVRLSSYVRHWIAAAACAGTLVLVSGTAHAIDTILDVDPSVVASGMGGAGTAVPWSADPDDWANPAMIAYFQGLSYRWTTIQTGHSNPSWLPGPNFATNRFAYGWNGLGIRYGTSMVGAYSSQSFERVRPIGLGASLSGVTNAIADLRHTNAPDILRHVDVAAGFVTTNLDAHTEPYPWSTDNGSARVLDYGILVAVRQMPTGVGHALVDVAYGYSRLNALDASFNSIRVQPVDRQNRDGVAMRIRVPVGVPRSPGRFGWLTRQLDASFKLTTAWDRSHFWYAPYVYDPVSRGFVRRGVTYNVSHVGAELDLWGVLDARWGYVKGALDGRALGFGVKLPIGSFAGLRYDWAQYPELSPDRPYYRSAIQAWLDPFAMIHR
jgi:hypothetical protein